MLEAISCTQRDRNVGTLERIYLQDFRSHKYKNQAQRPYEMGLLLKQNVFSHGFCLFGGQKSRGFLKIKSFSTSGRSLWKVLGFLSGKI